MILVLLMSVLVPFLTIPPARFLPVDLRAESSVCSMSKQPACLLNISKTSTLKLELHMSVCSFYLINSAKYNVKHT